MRRQIGEKLMSGKDASDREVDLERRKPLKGRPCSQAPRSPPYRGSFTFTCKIDKVTI
jgi:hypothetical protein